MTKNLTKIYTRDLKAHTSFVMETLTHSVSFYVYPLWLVQKDSVVFIHGDYKHTKRVWEDFVLQNLVQYYDLYVQSDILLPPDILKCHKIYELDLVHFLWAPGMVWQVCLKKTQVELELLIDPEKLLMVGKCIKNRICHAICKCPKASIKPINTMIWVQNCHTSCVEMSAVFMNQKYHKSCLLIISSEKRSPDSLRNSCKTMMMTARKIASLRLVLVVWNAYRKYAVICCSYLKE